MTYELMVRSHYPDVKCHRLPDGDGIYHIYVPNLRKIIGHGNDKEKAYKHAFLKTIQPLKRIEIDSYKFKTKQMKLTAAIAGAYLGCDAIYHDTEIEYFTPHRFKMLGVMTQMVFSMDNHYSMRFTKLILTPLSKISDEDAVEVVKIWYKGSEKISTISIDEGKRIALSMCVPSEITDYLRSKSYNIGYGKYTAQDLITEGVVIVNNKNKGI